MDSRPSSASRSRNLCRLEEEGADSFAIGATSAVMASTRAIRLCRESVFMVQATQNGEATTV